MIDKYGHRQEVVCDDCNQGTGKVYDIDDFDIMISDAKADGWRMRKENGEWMHYCSECK